MIYIQTCQSLFLDILYDTTTGTEFLFCKTTRRRPRPTKKETDLTAVQRHFNPRVSVAVHYSAFLFYKCSCIPY
jgi:hypothetical protein